MTSSDLVRSAGLSLVAGNAVDATKQQEVQRQPLVEGGNKLPQPKQQPAGEISNRELTEAVSNIADYVQSISRQLNFSIDNATGSTVVTVTDRETDEVIRQIPSEEALAISRFIDDQIDDPVKGLLVQNEA